MSVSGASGGGSRDFHLDVDGEANVPTEDPAPTDRPGTVAKAEVGVDARLPADLRPIEDLAQKFGAKKDALGGDFSTSLDQNLIFGVGHLDVTGKAKVGDDGVDGSVDAKGSFT